MKKALSVILVFVTVLVFCSCDYGLKDAVSEIQKTIVEVQNIVTPPLATYDEVYDKINNSIQNFETKITFENAEEDTVFKAYDAVYMDHPEYFWINGGYTYQLTTYDNRNEVSIVLPEISNLDGLKGKISELNNTVEKIVSEANSKNGTYEKIKYVHDYIINHTKYDDETADKILKNESTEVLFEASGAYGCLVEKSAVCTGYAAAFQIIAKKMGFECGRVNGKIIDGENHQWNYIKLDDEYYYIDVTWDDTQIILENKPVDVLVYDYFCVDTEELLKTHEIDSEGFVPECNGSKYNYFVYNDCYIEDYDYVLLTNIATRYAENNYVYVKFSSKTDADTAMKEMDYIMFWNIFPQGKQISYFTDTTGCKLTFYIY